jgi:hypothetical protein
VARTFSATDIGNARLWRRAAIALTEELLAVAKSGLFQRAVDEDAVDADVLPVLTRQLDRLSALDGGDLVGEFNRWLRLDPDLTTAMTRVVHAQDRSLNQALGAWLDAEEVAWLPQ